MSNREFVRPEASRASAISRRAFAPLALGAILLPVVGYQRARADQQPISPALQQGIDTIRQTLRVPGIEFRFEQPGVAASDLVTGNAIAGARPNVGSISKSVTAVGIALLLQQGRLRLDSRLADLLSAYFTQRGHPLDPSLANITVERLLTHRAGLRPNGIADPVHGLSTGSVLSRLGAGSDPFDFLMASGEAKSNGSTEFKYSNLSYLFLGIVVEAVTGQIYRDFCLRNVLYPLGITGGSIPASVYAVGPYGGWHLSLAEILKLWTVFDVQHPTILTRATLNQTILGNLGGPIGTGQNVHYAFGLYIKQDAPGGAYVLEHDGIADYVRSEPHDLTYVEKFVPGYAWAVTAVAPPGYNTGGITHELGRQTRTMVSQVINGH